MQTRIQAVYVAQLCTRMIDGHVKMVYMLGQHLGLTVKQTPNVIILIVLENFSYKQGNVDGMERHVPSIRE